MIFFIYCLCVVLKRAHNTLHLQINVPSCQSCGGILKLDVVMFGDNVPADLVGRAYEHVRRLLFSLFYCFEWW